MLDLEYVRFIEPEAIYAEAEVKVEILKQPVESVYLRLYGDLKIEQIEAVDQSMRIRGFVRKTEIKLGESGVAEAVI